MPNKNHRIPAFKYYFPPEEIEWITNSFHELLSTGGFLSLGSYCKELETNFAQYCGAKYGVTCNSGTASLELILRAMEISGKEIIVPANTFAATAFAVINAGGIPVFADILPDLTIDPKQVEAKITSNTAAFITVHIGGVVSPKTHELVKLSQKTGIPLIEDAAHAHGSQLDGQFAGTFGLAAGFSFFSTKVMTTGEGGMLLTDNEEIHRKTTIIRDQAKEGGNFHNMLGGNWRMDEFKAILGLSQLRTLEANIAERHRVARLYDENLQGISTLERIPVTDNVRENFYKYTLILSDYDRQALKQKLKQEYGITLGGYVYDIPLNKQPCFQPWVTDPMPIAEDLCARHICLPVYPTLSDSETRYICESIRSILS
ncbi:MAG: DegT/DnrJ/EryC1/StrS family aminotransferase [Spirulina sp. SIO3F2]|nr:DegT/DnrJ/EryC1/StrS family aminotransferase [Spirulina sp. SIO3F2]